MKIRNILSCFDGLSAGYEAIKRSNIEFDNYYAYEIDHHAIKCSQQNHPDIIHLGDINNWKEHDLKDIDLILAGSPCQSWSFSGYGKGLDDPRGQLLLTFHELLNHYSPKYHILENVVMKPEHQKIFNDLMGCEPIMLDALNVVPQSRKRLFWLSNPNIPLMEPLDVDIKKIIINDANNDESLWKGLSKKEFNELYNVDESNYDFGIGAMRGRRICEKTGTRSDYSDIPIKQYIEFRNSNCSNTLTTVQKDNVVVGLSQNNRIVAEKYRYRYLTIDEMEQLMDFPIGYTKMLSKTQANKCLGNSWVVGIIEHILKNLVK